MHEIDEVDEVSEDGYPVSLPSGALFQVLATSEVAYVEDRVKQYTETFKWENVSDIQDVDRIVIMELLCYRWGKWLAKTKDYFDDDIDEKELRKNLKEYAAELRQLKKSIGIDKATREKTSGADSVPAYLEKLRQRAKAFGVMRENQLQRALELTQTLIAMWQLYTNCDEQERREQRCDAEDIMDWIGAVLKPRFEEIDEHFRTHQQRFWTGEL